MSVLKRTYLFVFILFPGCLLAIEKSSHDGVQEVLSCKPAGAWIAQGKNGKTVVVEGALITKDSNVITSGAYLNILGVLADVLQTPNLEVVETYPLVLLNPLLLLSPLKMLFEGKNFRDLLYDKYVGEFNNVLSQECGDLLYLFTVSELQDNGEKVLLGSICFCIKEEYEYGSIDVKMFAVKQEAREIGLGKILLSSVFKLLPHVKRIFLEVLCTNDQAIDAYEALGFTPYENNQKEFNILMPIMGWYFLDYEYVIDTCSKLQDCAAMFEDV